MITLPEVWMGEPVALYQLYDRIRVTGFSDAAFAVQLRESAEREDEEEVSWEDRLADSLIEVYDSVGVLDIQGDLVASEKPWNSYFGVVAYPTITRALGMLAEDESVGSILMNIGTAGGSAEGVNDVSDAVLEVRKVNPVQAWTGSKMFSAGYWIGATAERVRASKMAQLGSVSAISTFMSIHRMLKEEGIDVVVSRGAPKKFLPHPMEPITKAGEDRLQKQVSQIHDYFAERIALMRPSKLSLTDSKETWASGETFFAQEAIEMGLADGPTISISELIYEMNAAHQPQSQSGDSHMAKQIVLKDELERTRLAAGATDDSLSKTSSEGEPTGDEVEQTGLQDGGSEVGDQGGAEEPPAAPAAGATSLESHLLKENAELRSENSELQGRIVEQASELAKLNTKAASADLLRPVAEKAVERLQVGLGHRPMKLNSLQADSLVELYEDLHAELMGLPVGQQSAQPDAQREELSQEDEIDPMQAARLQMIQGGKT